MDDMNQMLGVAERIKRPVPLAALAVLVAAAVCMALIRAGVGQVGTLGYVILGVVTIIAVLALVVALVVTKPRGASIRTAGSYSPGDVGGDYSVGPRGPSTDRKPAGMPVRAEPGADTSPTSIETRGSHSPGRVGGDYSVQDKPPK